MLSLLRRRPKPVAAPFPAEVPAGQRVYAIGDVHGRLDLLEDLLGRIHADDAALPPVETHVMVLGDLIDRGPASAGVVRRVMAGDARFASFTSLRGNHEQSLLSVLDGDTRWLASWLTYGGRAALLSWGVAEDLLDEGSPAEIAAAARAAVPVGERQWLAALPASRRIGGYLFVHAGVRPGVPLDRQSDEDMMWIRQEFLEDESEHGAVVIHGHTIFRAPQVRTNRIGIDTGAYISGTLTAVALEGREHRFLATAESGSL